MKSLIVLSCMLALSCAAPASHLRDLPALKHEEVHDEHGQYAFRYITADGTVHSERGYLIRAGSDDALVLVIEGQYQFVGDDGKLYVTRYRGGPEGFQVLGDHLPVSVPVPAVAPSTK